MTKPASPKYAPEVRERAVRMVFEHEGEHASQWAAISSIAAKIGCNPETLRNWVRQAERDQGKRPGPTTDEQERIKALERKRGVIAPDQALTAGLQFQGRRSARWLAG
ncbi:transposase [Azospirillum thiophilum]|uniref:Transposase n=1 Tax=Azospirillum thiophilum TaxID=528244 RepID=A0AAC8ZX65_9PROT|nr:transposase [Azospirillum thiophilum]KJR62010.1 transposase [Azospirillum thiophilum]